jgi:putative aminopeptidase FrvX
MTWLVNYIDSKGYIKVIETVVLIQVLRIYELIFGVIRSCKKVSWTSSIHFRIERKMLRFYFIDVGASSKKVEGMGINVGTVVTLKTN